ncbi:MAG: glycosyltransferase family 4 protein [Nitrososphaera sp.]|jgi:glycosyltransferase involved in cell wall biosynthesis
MNSFRILQVTPFYPPDKGGIATHTLNLSNQLSKSGHDITIVAPRPRRIKYKPSANALKKILTIPSVYLPGWPYPTLKSFSIPVDFGKQLDEIIKTGNFDIIHAHGHHYPITWSALRSAAKYGIPSVLTLHGMYALNPHVDGGKSNFEVMFNKLVFKRVLRKTNCVIGLTKQITDYGRTFATRKTSFYTIGNGVDTQKYHENLNRKLQFRQKYNIPIGSKVVLFVGRFEHVKGILELSRAAKSLIQAGASDLHIVLVGAGSLDKEVRSILDRVDSAQVLSWQSSETIHELYIASDFFILPSKFEALPITIIEAMNAGLHIIYTPVGGVSDVLEHYAPKTMIRSCTTVDIRSAISRLLTDNQSQTDIKESIRYSQNFDWSKIAASVADVYSMMSFGKLKVNSG